MPRTVYLLGKIRYTLYRRLGGPQGLSERVRRISTGTRCPDRPARCESLYRLSCTGLDVRTWNNFFWREEVLRTGTKKQATVSGSVRTSAVICTPLLHLILKTKLCFGSTRPQVGLCVSIWYSLYLCSSFNTKLAFCWRKFILENMWFEEHRN